MWKDNYTEKKRIEKEIAEQRAEREWNKYLFMQEVKAMEKDNSITPGNARERVLADFDTYFPNFTYYSESERYNHVDNLTDGEIQMYCY